MDKELKAFKRKIDKELNHIKVILTQERSTLPLRHWLDLVEQTKRSVISAPEDFFHFNLPERNLLTAAIEKVFHDFLEDQRIRAVQTSRPFRIPAEGS